MDFNRWHQFTILSKGDTIQRRIAKPEVMRLSVVLWSSCAPRNQSDATK
jgi:hypothetical protein